MSSSGRYWEASVWSAGPSVISYRMIRDCMYSPWDASLESTRRLRCALL